MSGDASKLLCYVYIYMYTHIYIWLYPRNFNNFTLHDIIHPDVSFFIFALFDHLLRNNTHDYPMVIQYMRFYSTLRIDHIVYCDGEKLSLAYKYIFENICTSSMELMQQERYCCSIKLHYLSGHNIIILTLSLIPSGLTSVCEHLFIIDKTS